MLKKTLFLLIFLFFNQLIFSSIINIPGDYPTIQEGINVAIDGDTVLVQPGTYIENIDYNGKNIHVASLFLTTQDSIYIFQTIIDGNQNGHVVNIVNGEDLTAVLIGFTITNGRAIGPFPISCGGGINCRDSSPKFEYLHIINNIAEIDGGGIYCHNSKVRIRNCIISDNHAFDDGGGICTVASSIINLSNCLIQNNQAYDEGGGICSTGYTVFKIDECSVNGNFSYDNGGGIYANVSRFNIDFCVFTNNNSVGGAGAIDFWDSDAAINKCTFFNNSSHFFAGGISAFLGSIVNIQNSIISDNVGYGIYGTNLISYSNVWNNSSGNFVNCGSQVGVIVTTNANGDPCDIYYNIQMEPLFVDPQYLNFHLTENSPCIDAGNPNSPHDPDGTITDIGAFYYNQVNSIDSDYLNIPNVVKLFQNFPNPFNPSSVGRSPETIISYDLVERSDIVLSIYNIKGQKVKELVNKVQPAGLHNVKWSGKDESGNSVSSGFYLYKIKAENFTAIRKMLLIK